jgi:hypothetical protein
MKIKLFHASLLLVLLTVFSGCSLVEGIFKAGVWSGVIIVVLIIGLIIYFLGKMGKKG